MTDKSFIDWVSMSDKALSQTIGDFVKHHRLGQNKTQEQVSTDAGISRSTLSLLERGETVTVNSLIQVLRVLDLLNIMESFTVKEEISPIAYAASQKKTRKRARETKKDDKPKDDLGW